MTSMFSASGPAQVHHLARPGVTHPHAGGSSGASPIAGPARSPFRVAQAAVAEKLSAAPPRTVPLPLSAWATTYPNRPAGEVEVGLRLYSETDAVQARAAAAQKAWRLHPEPEDVDERVAAGDGVLMSWLVARCTCQPDDAKVRFFGSDLGGAEDLVPLALTPKGIEYLFDALNALLVAESPTVPEADAEDLVWLEAALAADDPWVGMDPLEARRARRMLGAAIELMRGETDG